MLDLKKLILVPLVCYASVQQASTEVRYDSKATKELQNGIKQNNEKMDEKCQKVFTSIVQSSIPKTPYKDPESGRKLEEQVS